MYHIISPLIAHFCGLVTAYPSYLQRPRLDLLKSTLIDDPCRRFLLLETLRFMTDDLQILKAINTIFRRRYSVSGINYKIISYWY